MAEHRRRHSERASLLCDLKNFRLARHVVQHVLQHGDQRPMRSARDGRGGGQRAQALGALQAAGLPLRLDEELERAQLQLGREPGEDVESRKFVGGLRALIARPGVEDVAVDAEPVEDAEGAESVQRGHAGVHRGRRAVRVARHRLVVHAPTRPSGSSSADAPPPERDTLQVWAGAGCADIREHRRKTARTTWVQVFSLQSTKLYWCV